MPTPHPMVLALLLVTAACTADGPAPLAAAEPPDAAPIAEAAPPPEPTTEAAPAPEPPPADPCALGPDTSTWSACEGKQATLTGTAPLTVHQHPMLTGPGGQSQGYLQVGERQVIVISDPDAPECERGKAMQVVGSLEAVDLGGEPGTKASYTGWAVYGASISCP